MTIGHIMHRTFEYTVTVLGPAGALAALLFLLVYAGVVLPAVWSRCPHRRSAAHRTLITLAALLRALRRRR